jgi:hypothetical protein
MNELLDQVVAAYGGREQWEQLRTITAHQMVGGALWGLKQQDGILNDATVTVRLHEEWASHTPFTAPDRHTAVTPSRVAIETSGGDVVSELVRPRESFAGHELTTPWSLLQLAYFGGYAMWTYLSEPASLTLPGVNAEEIEPWTESGETWQRLRVSYPPSIGTHSPVQTLYIDADRLIRRRDYDVEIMGGAPSVQYISEHRQIDGVTIATRRRVHQRNTANVAILDPTIVSIDLDQITLG